MFGGLAVGGMPIGHGLRSETVMAMVTGSGSEMSSAVRARAVACEQLSALADGEADAAATTASCAMWQSDSEMRRDWHSWQLIGDVLRSDELASDAGHDAAFLASFRARLALEPVVLAPAPLSRASSWQARWVVPSAIAAGLVLAVGTFSVLRPAGVPQDAAPSLALAGSGVSLAEARPAGRSARDAGGIEVVTMTRQEMVRDPQLNRYLSAHKQFAGTSALGVPSPFLRSATVDSSAR